MQDDISASIWALVVIVASKAQDVKSTGKSKKTWMEVVEND